MYISTQLSFKLDEIIKSFEVALRLYLSEKILLTFNTKEEFINHIKNLQKHNNPSSIMFSSKIDSILKNFINNNANIYDVLKYTNSINNDYNEVPYVSDLVSIIIIFFKELDELKYIHNNYKTVEEFLYKCSLYHRIRNDLSHPDSRKILQTEASDTIKLILKILEAIDSKYFKFVSKKDIESKINDYYRIENVKILKYDNLKNINVSHQKTICRESELSLLHNCIIGEKEYSRVAGSTIIFGYGGVGKTALVLDFIYEIIQKKESDNKSINYDFILFFSSKDEALKTYKTTGEYYIDKLNSDIHKIDDILSQIYQILNLESFEELQKLQSFGLIVIDNIENLNQEEKNKMFSVMKSLPRNIQFLLTSRSEEPCEEKIHLSEFKDYNKGKEFILNYIEANDFNLILKDEELKQLLESTKGNTLLLVQSLVSLNDKTTSVGEIFEDLNNYESSSFDKIVNFMYKNTFDNAIKELENNKYNPKEIILIATLYQEKIDLYALSKLTNQKINSIREVCNFLTSKLIFNKIDEFYTVNEFASRFIFISLMPNKREVDKIKEQIISYKDNLNIQLKNLDKQMQNNNKIKDIINDWRPHNYIDKIVIAEAFGMFDKFKKALSKKNHDSISKLLEEYQRFEITTKHPYIRFQKARIFNQLYGFKLTKENRIEEINRCYEDALESINSSYSYIQNTESHIAVLMLYGFFLYREIKDLERAIKYLEEAKSLVKKRDKKFYLIRNELYKIYIEIYNKTNDKYYIYESENVYNEIIHEEISSEIFDISKFKEMAIEFKKVGIKKK